jgi:hypothetical protein
MMTAPGQASGFMGYGGIEDPDLYMAARYGHAVKLVKVIQLPSMPRYDQAQFEQNAPNCVLVAVTRVLEGFRTEGYEQVPADNSEIYQLFETSGFDMDITLERADSGTIYSSIRRGV